MAGSPKKRERRRRLEEERKAALLHARLYVRVSKREKDVWEQHALAENMALGTWVRAACNDRHRIRLIEQDGRMDSFPMGRH